MLISILHNVLCVLSVKDDSSHVPNGDPQIKQTSNWPVLLHIHRAESTLENIVL